MSVTTTTPLRAAIKRLTHPLVPQSVYIRMQATAMARSIRAGRLTEPEVALLPLALRPGECAVDVGANYGLYSYHLGQAAGPQGSVFAFEPVPYTCQALRQVLAKLECGNVRVFEQACSDRPGQIEMVLPLQISGAPAAGQAHAVARDNRREGAAPHVRWSRSQRVVADAVRLDDAIPESAQVALLKCDIEGAELFALRGAERILRCFHPTLICEINPWFLGGFALTVTDLVGFLESHGYDAFRYAGAGGDVALKPVRQVDMVEDNYVFVHPSRMGRLQGVVRQDASVMG